MNIMILSTIGKWISCLLVGFVSLFSGNLIEKEKLESSNINQIKSYSIVNETIPYESRTVYNSKTPSTITKVLVEGEIGIQTQVEDETIVVKDPVTEVLEKGTGAAGEFVGRISGYGPDCKGCSSTGTVACRTKDKKSHSLVNDGIYYQDETYGQVRILSATTAFPCGTIIKVDNQKGVSFYGIVLDRGATMNKYWNQGIVWIDLAYASQNEAKYNGIITGWNISFSVQRWGF